MRFFPAFRAAAIVAAMAAFGLALSSAESNAAAGPITVTPITWNVVGLANNNGEVSSGPYEYPSGVRVCNTGSDPVTGVSAAWTWVGGINAVSSNLWTTPTDNTSQSLGSLAGGACQDVYFDLQIKQIQSNRDKVQQRTVTVTSTNAATATNTQYIYVESLVKQNRNSTEKLSGPGGCNLTYTVCDPAVTNLYVGQTYTYKFYAQTATGYDELDAFALFPTFTQVTSTQTTYGTVTSPGPTSVSRIWSDACTWTGVSSSSSGSCVTAGKSGGRLVTTYTVKAVSAGTGSVPDLIYDHSGSSFHYNADWSTSAPILASSFSVYWKLAAAVSGNGTVTSNVAGAQPTGGTATIDCGAGGTVCAAGYSSGTVTLTATPGAGQQFTGWSGDGSCSGSSTTCTVTMSQSRSVTATFTGVTQYPLYVTKFGSGTVTADSGAVNCGATCSGPYANGTLVTLTASPAAGWSFAGWSGDCAASATSPTCQVTLSQERDVTATFTQNTYTLTVHATGTGAGDLCSNNSNQTSSGLCSPSTEPVFLSCGSSTTVANFTDTTCSGTFPSGTSVTLYPMCNGGSSGTPCPGGSGPSTVSFGGYTGGTCTGNATTGCTFTMDQNRTVNANFVLGSTPDLTIAKSHVGDFSQGDTGKTYSLTVTNVGTLASYSGKTITVTDSVPTGLTITAMSGTGWTCTTLPTCTQVLGSNLAAGASLNPITVTVNVAANASTPLVNSATVACSSSCNDDATNDSATDSTNILTPADLTLSKQHTGNFTQGSTGTYTLTVSNTGGQATSGTVTVTDSLPGGFTKSSFSGTGWDCSTSTSSTLTCTRSDALAAGSSYPAINAVVNVSATAVTATNTASVAGGGESNSANDTSSDPTTVVAALTVATAGNGSGNVVSDVGSINCGSGGSTCTDSYDTAGGGTVVTLTETPDVGSNFAGWSGACSGSGSTCQVTMSQARSVTATFTLQTFTLQITTSGAGTGTITSDVGGISCNQNAGTCSHTYNYGSVVTLSESPAGGSSFGGWSGGCTVSGATCVATMTQARSVTAQFDLGPQPDMTVAKSHVGNFTQGDTGDTYTITATNSGTGATSGTVTVVDTLPSGLTATAISGGATWSCTLATLTCTTSTVLGAGLSYPSITVTVNVAGNAAASVTNDAAVSGGGEVVTSNDTVSDPTTIVQNPVLSIAKVHNPSGSWRQGDTGVASDYYTLTVSNGSASSVGPTTGTVTVTDTAPTGLTITAMSGTGWTCTTLPTCTRSDSLARGGSYPTITVSVDVASNAAATVTNGASVRGGGCVSSPCDSTTDDTPITARYTLTVAKDGNGSGTVTADVGSIDCGATCNDTYDDGTVVTLSATPATGSDFTGWSGACSGTGTCQVTMSQARSVTATFTLQKHDLSVTTDGNGSGSVTSDVGGIDCTDNTGTCDHAYDYGTVVTLTATPDTGSDFTGWSGACSGTGACQVTMDQARSVTATFALQKRDLSVATDGNGSGSVTSDAGGIDCADNAGTCSDSYDYGTVVTLTATPGAGSDFTSWAGACSGTGTCQVTMDQARSVTATFTLQKHDLSVATDGNGAGSVTSDVGGIDCTDNAGTCSDSYDYGTVVTLTATPATGSDFTGWSGACSGTGICQVTMDQARSVTATFSLQKRDLSVATDGNGSGSVTSDVGGIDCTDNAGTCSDSYDYGTVVTLTPTPATGSDFTGWSGDCSGTSTCQVTLDQARTVTATFTLQKLDLSVTTDGNGSGSVTSDVGSIDCTDNAGTCADSYDFGTKVTLTASAGTDSTFMGWSGDVGSCDVAATTCQVTMDQARSVTASFGRANLLVTKSHTGNFSQGDTGDTYAIAVDNIGDGPTTEDVTVTEEPPASLTVTAMTGTGWSCSVGTLTCTRSDSLDPAASYPDITVTVDVSPTAPASATNSATVDGGGCAASPCSSSDDPTTIDAGPGQTASISGLVYHDLNANGTQDAGEPGLEDWQVWVDLNGNGDLDPGDPTTQTAIDGSYSIAGLDPGTYTVYETAPGGWQCSQPDPCRYEQTFTAGQDATGLDFGNYRPALVRGTMFDDLNRDGRQEAGEPGLGGWRIYVDYNDNGQWDPDEPFALTSSASGTSSRIGASSRGLPGHYTISGIVPGDWSIREIRQNGYSCTLPFNCAYRQTFLEGSVIDNRDFATYKPELAGKATLQTPQACVRGSFVVSVKGRQITRVVVTVAPGFHRTLHGKPSTHEKLSVRLVAGRLTVGAHRVTARVYFTQASATKSVLLRSVVYRCGKPSAAFTG